MTMARGMGWIALLVVWSAASAGEPKASVVLTRLQAEKIGSVALERVGPRQVVGFVHERLVAHAKREGYRLVWEVAEPLPERPRVSFGMENGSLALLLEAAATFADLAVTDNDEELVVRSRSVARAVRATRRFPLRDEFWRSIRPRDPQEFFRQLGIEFPEGTEARRSRDRRDLVVTHNPETLALVDEILQVTYAYPYRWQLKLSLLDPDGNEMPFAQPLALRRGSGTRARHYLGSQRSFIEVSAKEEYWYRAANGLRFPFGVRAVLGGKTVFRQDTTLVLCHGVGTDLQLGELGDVRVVAECDWPGRKSARERSWDHPREWPWGGDEEMSRTLEAVLPEVRIEEKTIPSALRRFTAALPRTEARALPLGVAYIVPSGVHGRKTRGVYPVGIRRGVSMDLWDVSVANVLRYMAAMAGLNQRTSANGVILHDARTMLNPLQQTVYGPSVFGEGSVDTLFGLAAPPRGGSRDSSNYPARMVRTFRECGVGFPPGARLCCAACERGWVVVVTNSRENTHSLDSLLAGQEEGLHYSSLWHTEVRLVRLLPHAPEGDEIRRLLASSDAEDRFAGAQKLGAFTEYTVFSVWGSGADGKSSTCLFPGVGPGGESISLTVTATNRPSQYEAEVRLDISGGRRTGRWRSSMRMGYDKWPRWQEWAALRADSMDPERPAGWQSYLLVHPGAQPVWMDSRECQARNRASAAADANTGNEKRAKERTAYWDLLFMFGLIEAGDQAAWSPHIAVSYYAPECRELLDTEWLLLSRIEVADRQCRLRLVHYSSEEVVECLSSFGEDAVVPAPGRPGKSLRFRVTEVVRGERAVLRWGTGLGWPRTRELAAGKKTPLGSGLHASVETVGAWHSRRVEPACATEVQDEGGRRAGRVARHRAVLERYGGMKIAHLRLRDSPLPMALAEIGSLCRGPLPNGAKVWRLAQPVFYGPLPEGSERVPWPGDREVGREVGDDGPCAGRQRGFCGTRGPGMGMWMDESDSLSEQEREAERNVPDQRGGIADSGLPDCRRDGSLCCSAMDLAVELCDKHRLRATGGDDSEYDKEDELPLAVAYRLPAPKGRATLDLRHVTLAELLVELEKAYGVPLYLREKDGEVLVRAAPLAHVARFGVPKKRLKAKTQAEFRAWLAKRGVAFQGDDRAVYFRPLDTVVARGREDFVLQVGKALGKGRERDANAQHRTSNIER